MFMFPNPLCGARAAVADPAWRRPSTREHNAYRERSQRIGISKEVFEVLQRVRADGATL